MPDNLKRIFLEASVLIAFAALFGLTVNHQLVLDAFAGRLVSQRPVETVGNELRENIPLVMPMPVLLDEIQPLMNEGGLLVDARNQELFAAGHIQGAISLPWVDMDDQLPDFIRRIDRDRIVVTYCSGFGCPDSFDLGIRLIEAGYGDVRVFEGGYPEWRDAGLPVVGESQ